MIALALAASAGVTPPLGEPVAVQTADGAWIALRHAPGDGPSVLLCHGISSNGRFWDLEPGRSLARYLHERGYDVWNLDLRGHGEAMRAPDGARQRPGWTVDDYGRHDLPAAIEAVRATGRDRLHFVGHSMGGMVLAVYLATTPDPPLASAVAVGSPLDFRDPDLLMKTLLDLGNGPVGEAFPFLGTHRAARVARPLRRSLVLDLDALLHNPANLERGAEGRMFRDVVSPLSRGEVGQFAQAARDGEFRSADGSVVYREALGAVRVPMLFVAGRADRLVTPDRVWTYHEAVGSQDKAFLMASEANGMHADYGHLDLGLGDHVELDLFAPIEAWLAGHP